MGLNGESPGYVYFWPLPCRGGPVMWKPFPFDVIMSFDFAGLICSNLNVPLAYDHLTPDLGRLKWKMDIYGLQIVLHIQYVGTICCDGCTLPNLLLNYFQ